MNIQQWTIAAFAVFGAFVACGFGGAGVASLLGLWESPIAGFAAAFGVVSMTYLSVPSKNRLLAAAALLIGTIVAWVILEPSYYPELFQSRAYEPTHLPFIATVIGGVVALAICRLPYRRNSDGAYAAINTDA